MGSPNRGSLSPGTRRGEAARRSANRELLAFIRRDLIPFARRERRSGLHQALRGVVDSGDPTRLGRLTEHMRAELLELVERKADAARRSIPPRAVVRLVSSVFPNVTSDESVARWRTTFPAR